MRRTGHRPRVTRARTSSSSSSSSPDASNTRFAGCGSASFVVARASRSAMVAPIGKEAFLPLAAPMRRRVIRVGMPTTTRRAKGTRSIWQGWQPVALISLRALRARASRSVAREFPQSSRVRVGRSLANHLIRAVRLSHERVGQSITSIRDHARAKCWFCACALHLLRSTGRRRPDCNRRAHALTLHHHD